MAFITKVLRVVKKGDQVGGVTITQPVRIVDEDGEDVELGEAGPVGLQGPVGPQGIAGKTGASVTAIALTTDASGKVTGGTATLSDKTTVPITVTAAGA